MAMSRGFRFNSGKCVACGACSAACMLENGWNARPRNIYSYNQEALAGLPVVNFSLACNHCETPACLEACPAGAYSRDINTAAIILDGEKCIGCKYCQWNCPYDAPKFDTVKNIIEKCHLCHTGLVGGLEPACVSSCPTGALKYGELSGSFSENIPVWFPDNKLNPALEITRKHDPAPLKIIPDSIFENQKPIQEGLAAPEWSLVIFSFFSTLSVSLILSSLITGNFPGALFFLSLILITAISSLFHLGKVLRAWRGLANIRRSPLSREIAFFLLYSALSVSTVFLKVPVLLIISSVAGMIFLISVDMVYIRPAGQRNAVFHNGQTFINTLLLASFFSLSIIPFTFIVLIKIALFTERMFIDKFTGSFYPVRFFSTAIMLIIWAGLVSGVAVLDNFTTILLTAGVLLDRIVFYIDFNPVNITKLINKHIKAQK